MTVRKIISGGQTGADRAALVAARRLGLATGGTAPAGWRTDAGPDPSLEDFGLQQHPQPHYAPRTRCNVRDSDGTVAFGTLSSPGMRLTRRTCRETGKPFLANPRPEELRAWCAKHDIEVLNVAGNRESVQPGIGERVIAALLAAFGHPAVRYRGARSR